jgi:ABC-type nitrate/sulfonate/bicarbonate transport system permease component
VFKRNANELKKKMWWKNIKVFTGCALYLPPATVRMIHHMAQPTPLNSSHRFLVTANRFIPRCFLQMWLIIGFIIAVILAIIIGVAVSYTKSAQAAAKNNSN